MWEKYYKMCSDKEFRSTWNKLLENSIGFQSCPIFYQFVTKVLLEDVIKRQFPIDSTSQVTSHSLDFQESNALRYCAGYLLRSLKNKINRSAHPLKQKLLLCVKDLCESEYTCIQLTSLIFNII